MADRESVTIHVRCSDLGGEAERQRRSALCNQVLKEMKSELLSCPSTVICLIDDRDFDWAKQKYGQENRGHFSAPIKGLGLLEVCPRYFFDLIAPFDSVRREINYLFDSVIYVHGTTCLGTTPRPDVGLALTLAHELCHFRQYANQPAIFAANKLFGPPEPLPNMTAWTDIPIEVEARQVAKLVAQSIFEYQTVQDYIAEKAQNPVNKADGDDWKFIFDLPTSIPYNLVESTKALVEKHKTRLEMKQTRYTGNDLIRRLNLDTLELRSLPADVGPVM
jgi:hypothetical protein